jgi:hypothetical protein
MVGSQDVLNVSAFFRFSMENINVIRVIHPIVVGIFPRANPNDIRAYPERYGTGLIVYLKPFSPTHQHKVIPAVERIEKMVVAIG